MLHTPSLKKTTDFPCTEKRSVSCVVMLVSDS